MLRFVWLAAALLSLFTHSASAQDKVQWTTNYYAVTGDTLAEIRESLRECRPWKDKSSLDGSTEWRVDWRFKLRRVEEGCRIQQFTTTTTIIITLPRWTASTNAAAGVQQAWTRYATALVQHENGHAKIGLAAAAALRQRIQELGQDFPCETLKQKLDALGKSVVSDFKTKDQEYDRTTQHGATQGARLPVALRPAR